MGYWWGRVMVLLFIVSSAATILALWAGQSLDTLTITDYLTYEGVTYTLLIRDGQRDLTLNLIGTRCFEPLPPWVEEPDVEPSSDPYGQYSQVHYEQMQDAMRHLRC